jgi:cytidylate kinase
MPIITISRGTMSGGQALASCLCSTLGTPCVGRESIVVEAAEKLGVSNDLLARKLETAPGLWDRLTLERRRYVIAVQSALAERIVSGNLVYHGYAGQMLLRGLPCVLRVRLIAPLAMRVTAVMETHGMQPEAAEAYIAQIDEERVRWTRQIYGVELTDPSLYDLVVNLETTTIESACAIVAAAARRPEFVVGAEARLSLEEFALGCRVKVALVMAAATRTLDLGVEVDEGAATVRGRVPEAAMLTHVSGRLEQEITEIVLGVEGVRSVTLDLRPINQYH